MFIKKLILHKYARLFLNNIEHLELTPENNIQILLGRNGSGKTSILNMLNPLPANIKKEFKEDGYKLIEIEHHGKEYVLSSNYLTRGKHSFVVDNGIELNPGGTRKVQLELVHEHFRLTPDINQVLIGGNNFTAMSSVERKHWFTELSTVDYTFSITLYNRLKQRYRDITGGIKLVQEEIVKAEANVNSDINLEKLTLDKKHIEEMISFLLSSYSHVTVNDSAETITNDIVQLNLLTKQTLTNITDNLTMEAVEKELTEIKIILGTLEQRYGVLNKEIAQLDLCVADEPLEQLELKEKALTVRIQQSILSVDIDIDINKLEYIIDSYRSAYDSIIDSLNTLSEFNSVQYSTTIYNETFSKLKICEQHIRAIENQLSLATLEKNRYEQMKTEDNKVVCDNCNHEFYFKYNETLYNNVVADVNKKSAQLNVLKDDYEKTLTLSKLLDSKKEAIQAMVLLMQSNQDLIPVWEYVTKKYEPFYMNTTGVLGEIDSLLNKLERWEKIIYLKKELSEIQLKLSSAREFKRYEIVVSKERQIALEKELIEQTILKNKTMARYNELETQRKHLIKLNELTSKLKQNVRYFNKQMPMLVIKERNSHITELVKYLKNLMIDIDHKIILHQQQKTIVNENKVKLEQYLIKEKLLNIVLKELSPSEGIIAKSMNSFLNVFINEMNTIINTVWSYSMELLPCEISEENDLDYKFRVLVDGTEIIDDICDLSSSMQEIVNLAFRIVFIKYLNVPEVPLFLDEFGRTMDPTHRINAYNIIEQVMADSFVQIFIVSHFESMYGRFNNADISILDANNIDTSSLSLYNTVLKIE